MTCRHDSHSVVPNSPAGLPQPGSCGLQVHPQVPPNRSLTCRCAWPWQLAGTTDATLLASPTGAWLAPAASLTCPVAASWRLAGSCQFHQRSAAGWPAGEPLTPPGNLTCSAASACQLACSTTTATAGSLTCGAPGLAAGLCRCSNISYKQAHLLSLPGHPAASHGRVLQILREQHLASLTCKAASAWRLACRCSTSSWWPCVAARAPAPPSEDACLLAARLSSTRRSPASWWTAATSCCRRARSCSAAAACTGWTHDLGCQMPAAQLNTVRPLCCLVRHKA